MSMPITGSGVQHRAHPCAYRSLFPWIANLSLIEVEIVMLGCQKGASNCRSDLLSSLSASPLSWEPFVYVGVRGTLQINVLNTWDGISFQSES